MAWRGSAGQGEVNKDRRESSLMAVKTVNASILVEDMDLYPRANVDAYHVRELAEALEAGATLPAIIADAESKCIIDGFHRRRAAQKTDGLGARVKVEFRSYTNRAEMFEDAMRLNSSHGKGLTRFDKVRALHLASELGIKPDTAAKVLNVTVQRAEGLLIDRVAGDGQILKRTIRHLADSPLTEDQKEANTKLGGMNQGFYIDQVYTIVSSGSVDWENEKVVSALKRLKDELNACSDLHL